MADCAQDDTRPGRRGARGHDVEHDFRLVGVKSVDLRIAAGLNTGLWCGVVVAGSIIVVSLLASCVGWMVVVASCVARYK